MSNVRFLIQAAKGAFDGANLSGSVQDTPFCFVRQEIAEKLPQTENILGEGRRKTVGDLVPVFEGKKHLEIPDSLGLIVYTPHASKDVGKGLKEVFTKQGIEVLAVNCGENAVEVKLPLTEAALTAGRNLADNLLNLKVEPALA